MSDDRAPLPSPAVDDPRIAAFLPMLYVAWADGDLSPEEMGAICERVTAADEIDGDCRRLLGRWLDPGQPPSARELQRLLSTIRRTGAALSRQERRTLAELGIELARAGGHEPKPAELGALAEIDTVLGIRDGATSRALLAPERPAVAEPEAAPAFDLEALERYLAGERRPLRREVMELLSAPRFAYRYGIDTASYRELVFEWCRELAAGGYGALSFPSAGGGAEDLEGFVTAFETVAFHDLSLLVKFGVQFGLFGGSIQQLGSERHHRRYLPAVSSLELPGCFAMTEIGHGSNVAELETVARYDPESQEFVVHTPTPAARKDWIGNAARHGRMATVFAQLEVGGERYGVHALLVPIRDDAGRPLPGVSIEDCGEKMGLNGVDNGRLAFDRVRVPRENLLDRFATVSAEGEYASPIASPSKRFFTMLGTLVGGRVSIAAAAVSATKSALTIAIRYGDRRRQFGPDGEAEIRILDYLTHQRRLLPRLATTYAAHFAAEHLVELYVASATGDRRQVEALAAGLKAFTTWHATDTIQTCREACGGQGYLSVNRLPALKADTDVFTTFEGDNTVLLQLVAKSLLTGFRRQFGELSVWGMLRYVAGRASTALSELNPIVVRNTDEGHLRDPEFQLAALSWREEHLVTSAARRMKKRLDAGIDPFNALLEVQDHLVVMAKAHVERVVLERFQMGVERCDDPAVAAMLKTLCDLFALDRLERDRGWFLEHGYIADAKAKAIRDLINKLCGELRPHAVALVDAFAIPDALLAAPIAVPGRSL